MALLADIEEARTAGALAAEAARAMASTPAVTADGETIEVSANVGTPEEVAPAVAQGADGVGLFRTEFLFMDRDAMPTEDEQEAAYRLAAEALQGRPLAAANPRCRCGQAPPLPRPAARSRTRSSGCEGCDWGWRRPDLLLPQLRAVVRVAADFPVRVMFPMVATADELSRALELLERLDGPWDPAPELETGIMVEVPAAALTAAALAPSRRLLLDRHERPDAVRARRRSRQRTRRGAVRRVAPSRAPAHRGHHHRRTGTWSLGRRLRRTRGRCQRHVAVARPRRPRTLDERCRAIAAGQAMVRGTDIPEAEALAAKALACAVGSPRSGRSWRLKGRCYDAPDARMTSADDRAATFLQAITYLRIALTPVVMALIWVATGCRAATPAAATLFAIAAVTDYFDGPPGSTLEADDDARATSSTRRRTSCSCRRRWSSLVAVGRCSMWVAFIIIGREMLVMGLRGAVTAGTAR